MNAKRVGTRLALATSVMLIAASAAADPVDNPDVYDWDVALGASGLGIQFLTFSTGARAHLGAGDGTFITEILDSGGTVEGTYFFPTSTR